MRTSDRSLLRERFGFRCGYCGVSETEAGALLTVDHFHPLSRGGTDAAENRVYCCHNCNESKGDWWNPKGEKRILHPIDDPIPDHIREAENGTIRALTPTGAFHIARLRLNRGPLVAHRLQRQEREQSAAAIADTISRLQRLEDMVAALTATVETFRRSEHDND